MGTEIKHCRIQIKGLVQGVGFRPFILTTAESHFLKGYVKNVSEGVVIEVEGIDNDISQFMERIQTKPPPLAVIKSVEFTYLPVLNYSEFSIRESQGTINKVMFVSPDLGICDECENELFDPENRRYQYPFINCNQCGPRFTIISGYPYDRKNTTMKSFKMCEACRIEYEDARNRRYRAEAIGCCDCGPEISLLDASGKPVLTHDTLTYLHSLINSGKIIAMKGLGGYHLVCNAYNLEAVRLLRERKLNDEQPLEIMVKDTNTAFKHCYIDNQELSVLSSPKRPIVLLKKRLGSKLASEIAFENPCLAVMLPYTPLHLILFSENSKAASDTLVMTSAYKSGIPIYFKDSDTLTKLSDVADYFLIHNRDIQTRTDDSITRVFMGKERIIRRSRGYVPTSLDIAKQVFTELKNRESALPSILACGAALKNTFVINRGNEFYISHHIGDLENVETYNSFMEGIEHYKQLFSIRPKIIAHDMNPSYFSTQYAKEQAAKIIDIQHHEAHVAACMAENGLWKQVIGIVFDGDGYGRDGKIWGGEFFTGNYYEFSRIGHFEYVGMPGGDMAVKEPWRMALAYLNHAFNGIKKYITARGVDIEGFTFAKDMEGAKLNFLLEMLDKNINSPLNSSVERLFDAVTSLIGLRSYVSYDGQAAIELEYESVSEVTDEYSFTLHEDGKQFIVSVKELIKGITIDIRNGVSKDIITSKFHRSLASIIVAGCINIRQNTGLSQVVLSGSIFENMILLQNAVDRLTAENFTVYTHSSVPTNDSGLCLGQAIMALFSESRSDEFIKGVYK